MYITIIPYVLVPGIPSNHEEDCAWWVLHEATRENEQFILTTRKKKCIAECFLALCYSALSLILTINVNSNHSHLQVFYCQRDSRDAANLSNLCPISTNLSLFFFLFDRCLLHQILGPFWPIRNLAKSLFFLCPWGVCKTIPQNNERSLLEEISGSLLGTIT